MLLKRRYGCTDRNGTTDRRWGRQQPPVHAASVPQTITTPGKPAAVQAGRIQCACSHTHWAVHLVGRQQPTQTVSAIEADHGRNAGCRVRTRLAAATQLESARRLDDPPSLLRGLDVVEPDHARAAPRPRVRLRAWLCVCCANAVVCVQRGLRRGGVPLSP
eukprot:3960574-Pleurochrysis_carterae.AAC.4